MCALLSGGTVECWGQDTYDELGNGAADNAVFTSPVPVVNLGAASAIAVGGTQTCALVSGTWTCWGEAGWGIIGVPEDPNTRLTLTPQALVSNATAFSMGNFVSCADVSGTIECVGEAGEGELGTSNLMGPDSCFNEANVCAMSFQPISSSLLTGVTALSSADDFVCALTSTGSVVCWGDNSYDELGTGGGATFYTCDNGGTCTATPVTITGVNNATAIATTPTFACALIRGGSVVCWGDDSWGELGQAVSGECNGSYFCSPTPLKVTGISNATAIAAGSNAVCAVIQGGTVQCWGADRMLGNTSATGTCQGTNLCSTTPVTVTGISNATAIASGNGQMCALLSDGNVDCWGSSSSNVGTAPVPMQW